METTETSTIQIRVNDQVREVASGTTLEQLVQEMGYQEKDGMAAAVNDDIIPKSRWENHTLHPEDRVTLIRATQGG